jgi:hypothetical protein
MLVFLSGMGRAFSSFLLQVRLKETFGHLLDAGVIVATQPGSSREIKFEITGLSGPIVSFANISKKKDACGNCE